jgi:putative membrane protein
MMAFGFGGFGMLFAFLFWIVIAGLIVWALAQALPRLTASNSGASHTSANAPQDNFALEILKQRFAKGEITREEYDDMRLNLTVV